MRFREPSDIEVLMTKLVFGSIGKNYFRRYVDSLGFKKTDKVLDYGSGTGIASSFISRNAGHVTCVDLSNKWLEIAKKNLQEFDNVDFKQGNIEMLDIPDGSFDAIFIHFVIHDVEAHERKSKILTLVKKLKKGGRIYQGEPSSPNHGMTFDEMNRLMADCGLKTISNHTGRMMIMGKVRYGVYEN